ncbi:MAG: lysophospholipid acyltransferase family protein [Spartobacteria bacterium]
MIRHADASLIERPHVSRARLKIFSAYNRRLLRRRFHSLRILKQTVPGSPARPLVIYLNHSSWWDPLVCLFLSQHFFADRASFAPIDSAMLERYRFFRHLGFFGIDPQQNHRAAKFLRTAHAILASPTNILWLTPQGRFVDVRARPLELQAGLGALASRTLNAVFVPLAIEYSFWTESRPEILVSFGESHLPSDHQHRSADEWTRVFCDTLESTQDDLAAKACRRNADDWLTLNSGRSGVNLVYDAWRRLRAKTRGETFTPEHHTQALAK